ncbi:hypothetical protein [Saccharopolyspora phatthalungensis]|uniref:Uncharacterized protein n=1 Tax=Saccharopolyspora phatthalungensis TaxID=664693 RepID=A0A840QAW1_9PSEU|nr:hypothetical protein [Saccharopolyspora phatthalungensis]MBB5157087.1 hypothetical protein [Saccharopolyspora phatthalungensis]
MRAKGALLVLGGAAGAAAYLSRAELNRYFRILRMSHDPALVGVSVTPQGNEAALGQSSEQRRRNRQAASVTAD